MVVLDATVLMLLLQPAAGVPNDAEGRPVERAVERIQYLVEQMEAQSVTIVIPTPALAEVLVRVGAKAAEQLVERLNRYWILRTEPFDVRAAVEVAAMTRDALAGGSRRGGSDDVWAKIKYDRQIVAIAKVNGASAIYSDDAGLRRTAARSEIDVIGLADLPLPPKAAERPRPAGSPRPQIDLLDQ